MTKITLKMCDIEVCLDDDKEPNRGILISEGLGCIDALVQSRIQLEGGIVAVQETAEDSPGDKPTHTEHKIRADITMAQIYA